MENLKKKHYKSINKEEKSKIKQCSLHRNLEHNKSYLLQSKKEINNKKLTSEINKSLIDKQPNNNKIENNNYTYLIRKSNIALTKQLIDK